MRKALVKRERWAPTAGIARQVVKILLLPLAILDKGVGLFAGLAPLLGNLPVGFRAFTDFSDLSGNVLALCFKLLVLCA